jgi:AMP-binding enzyme
VARAPGRGRDRGGALIELADPTRPLHVGALLTNSPAMLRAMAAAALGGYVLCGIKVTATDTRMMIFTSGTSGDPKAVRFAHGMAILCGLSLIGQFDITATDVCYLSMPLFHSNGVAAGWAVAIGSAPPWCRRDSRRPTFSPTCATTT